MICFQWKIFIINMKYEYNTFLLAIDILEERKAKMLIWAN